MDNGCCYCCQKQKCKESEEYFLKKRLVKDDKKEE
jgi:hypothetical protein